MVFGGDVVRWNTEERGDGWKIGMMGWMAGWMRYVM